MSRIGLLLNEIRKHENTSDEIKKKIKKIVNKWKSEVNSPKENHSSSIHNLFF